MGESVKRSVLLKFRLRDDSTEEVRYFYGKDAVEKAATFLSNIQPPPRWYEVSRITKITERLGGIISV